MRFILISAEIISLGSMAGYCNWPNILDTCPNVCEHCGKEDGTYGGDKAPQVLSVYADFF